MVRHGESRAQELGILGGHDGCQGLSDLGRGRSAALRDRLAATGELADATALYSSVMPRAVETAEILAPALGRARGAVGVRLLRGPPGRGRRAHLGRARGALPVHPTAGTPTTARVAGWETWREMGVRVQRALDSLVERHPGETVVVACHGGWWCRRCCTGSRSTRSPTAPPGVDRPRQLVAHRVALRPNPYQKDTLPVQLVRYNDHAHLGTPSPSAVAPAEGSTPGRRRRRARAAAWRGRWRSRASATSRRTHGRDAGDEEARR